MKKQLKPFINSVHELQESLEKFLLETEASLKNVKILDKRGPWYDNGDQLFSRAINHVSVAKKELSKIYDAVPRAKKKK